MADTMAKQDGEPVCLSQYDTPLKRKAGFDDAGPAESSPSSMPGRRRMI